MNEYPVIIPCEGASLVGIINKPDNPSKAGVVIVVAGGPQYRVGAHRQFVTLARMLSARNISSLRFDHRGTGDSGGEFRGFVDMYVDIRSAIDSLCAEVPELDNIVLWGECESATAIAFYAYTDSRVKGIFMVNPWIRTEEGEAKTFLKHYYWNRLFEKEFWLKLKSGKFSLNNSVKSFIQLLHSSRVKTKDSKVSGSDELAKLPLPERLEKSCKIYVGKIFTLTSGKDYIAQEFKDYISDSEVWQKMIDDKKMIFEDIIDSDHTFSRLEWREKLLNYSGEWITEKFM